MLSLKNIHQIIFISLALFFISPLAVSAQERVSFKLSPTAFEDNIEPGTERSFILNVENKGDNTMTLYPLARDILGVGSDQQPIYSYEEDIEGYALASWITYKESQLNLLPGEKKSLHFSIRFPSDAHPGSHMAGIFLADKSSNEVKNGSSIGFEVGSILNFRVAGEIVEDTQIREFFSSKSIYNSSEASFTVKLENRGNVLSRPRGFIDITNMFGKKVKSLPVNESGAGVFPKNFREFSVEWKPDDIQMGRYEASVALAVEGVNGTQTISRIVQFWILPMNILMPFFGGLLFLIVLVYILLRMYIRRQLAGVRTSRNVEQTKGLSRLTVVVIALLVAVILGLVALFFMLM